MQYLKPKRLQAGQRVAVLSASWGGPHEFPPVYEAGLRTLSQTFGLEVVEFPTTRMSPDELARNPKARAADFNAAVADPSINAIIASIGGDDSARILDHLDVDVIQANPKIMLGYSDTGTQLMFCNQLGLVTFNGPAVMAGFAQMANFPELTEHVRAMLFEPADRYEYQPFPTWTPKYADWSEPGNHDVVTGPLPNNEGWRWLNGGGVGRGRLFGGCMEVLEFLKGSRFWPSQDFWVDRILFLEASEEEPTIDQVRYWLFNYGIQGAFDQISGLLIGRARGYSADENRKLDQMVIETVVGQFGATELPIITNLDFGHTDPQWILPLGVMAELDSDRQTFTLTEPAVS